jgi:phage virion morphogenesis protein
MAFYSLELAGSNEALAALGVAIARAERPRELYDSVGRALVVSTQHRFEEEKDPAGAPWPASIRALADGGKTLTDSARLVGSMTHNASDTGLEVGTNVIYAAIHQVGGTITAKNGKALQFQIGGQFVTVASVTIPARPFLGIDDDDEAEIEALAGEFLLAPLGGVNAR